MLVIVGCQRPTVTPPKFQRKLAWRDLAYWQLALFSDLPWESLRPPYKAETAGQPLQCLGKKTDIYEVLLIQWRWQALRWSTDRHHLKAWQRGRTGYPLVAAVADRWDEQLHEARGRLLSHSVPPPAVAGRLPLVSGEKGRHGDVNHSTGWPLQMASTFLGHPGGRRCRHRCHDVAEQGHVRSGPLELRHAPRRHPEMVSGTVGAAGQAHPQTLEMSHFAALLCW